MRLAYLINQYPAVSHSFIRREIAALEEKGVPVARFSLRPPPTALADQADKDEQARTRVVLAAGAAALAFATAWIALSSPSRFYEALRATLRMSRRSGRGIVRHLAYLAEACLLLTWLRRDESLTHLHAHFGTNSAAVALLQRLLGGLPYSFTIHGPEEFDHPEELSLEEKIEHAEAVVAISEFGRSQIFRWIEPAQWPKVHVVHCGVDASFLADGPQAPVSTSSFVCVGRICPQKGQLLIVEALADVLAQGNACHVIFAGDGPLRTELEARIRDLGLAAHVTITGWISGSEVRRQLISSRALLLPSFAEGLPVVLMEALALGRPAITTYVAGIPELVQPGKHGWLIPAGSRQALAEAMQNALLTSEEDLARMGRHCATAAAERHDVRKEVERLVGVFGGEQARTQAVAGRALHLSAGGAMGS